MNTNELSKLSSGMMIRPVSQSEGVKPFVLLKDHKDYWIVQSHFVILQMITGDCSF